MLGTSAWWLIHAPRTPPVCWARTGFRWLVPECSKESEKVPSRCLQQSYTEGEEHVNVCVSKRRWERERDGERVRLCAGAMIKSFLLLAFECLVFDAVEKKSSSHTDIIKEQRNCLSSWTRRVRRGWWWQARWRGGNVKQFIHKDTTRQICIAVLAFCCLCSAALTCLYHISLAPALLRITQQRAGVCLKRTFTCVVCISAFYSCSTFQ